MADVIYRIRYTDYDVNGAFDNTTILHLLLSSTRAEATLSEFPLELFRDSAVILPLS